MSIPASRAIRLFVPRLALFALSALLLTTTVTAQPSGLRERGIRLLDLGTLGGNASSAWAVDDEGQVVGWSLLASGERRAFKTCADCTMEDLGTHIGGSDSIGRAVSGNGQWLVGSSGINAHGPEFREFTQGFVHSGGTMSSVDALFCPCSFTQRHGTSEAYGVNDHGTVVGWAMSPRATYQHAFKWKEGVMEDLSEAGLGDPSYSRAFDINNAEQIVGYIDRDDDLTYSEGDRDAFIWEDGAFRTLDHLPGYTSSTAVAINEAGQAVGWSSDVSETSSSAAYWAEGIVVGLGRLDGDSNSRALALNDRGQAVGWSGDAEGNTRAVYWQAGFMLDLNTLLPADSGWQFLEARGINNQGTVVGTAMVNGELRAFMLIPPAAQRLQAAARR